MAKAKNPRVEDLDEICNASGFDLLLKRNLPHIWEKIFLSLDYASFRNCLGVSHEWNSVLESESFGAKVRSAFSTSLWLDTEGLSRNVWKSGKNIINWTVGGNEEVAFVERIGSSKVLVHLIDSAGKLRSARLRFRNGGPIQLKKYWLEFYSLKIQF